MKKLFSIFIAFVLIITLSACTGSTEDASEKDALENKIDSLEDKVTIQRDKISEIESVVVGMESKINEDQVIFTVDTGETTLAKAIPYSESSELNAFELLNLAYDLEYQESEYGVFLEGIDALRTFEGSFIAISKNGTLIESGLSTVAFEGGDHFHFEHTWWDDSLEALHDSLQLFVDEQADAFIEENNYRVALGLHHLGYDTMLATMDVPELGDEPTDGELINHIFLSELLGEVAQEDRSALAAQADTQYAYSAALTYLALATGDISEHDGFVSSFTTMLDDLVVSETDNDSLSMVLLALTRMESDAYESLANEIVDYLESNAYNNTFGNNAAGYASIIAALVSADMDPSSQAFEEDGEDLIGHLMAHQTEEGAFLYQLESDEADLDFSTPQAFLALAAYQSYLNNDAFTHPYGSD